MQREQSTGELIRRYVVFSSSVLIISLGVALAVKAALGVSPIAALPYTISLIFTSLSVGTWNALWNFLLIVLQPVIRPANVKWTDLFIQCVMTCFFGYFIDFFLDIMAWYVPANYVMQIFTILTACCCLAMGAYLGMIAKVSMLPMDSLLLVISDVTKKSYAKLRVTGDTGLTIISALLCWQQFGQFIGVREGTIIAAILVGNLIRIAVSRLRPLTYFLIPEAALDDCNNVTLPKNDKEGNHLIVTISHEYGSGGRVIARRIAHELDLPYYDSDVIEQETRDSGYKERFIKENEVRIDKNALEELLEWYADSYRLEGEGRYSDEELFKIESRVIRDIAAKGACIIVGRLANYVLQNHGNYLHIFITADDWDRVQRVQRIEKIDEQAAAIKMLAFAEERREHCHDFSQLEWGNSLSYDITMKSNKYGVDRTAAILIELIKQFRNR